METVSVVEARKNFSELLTKVAYQNQRVLVERNGKPMVALISVEDLRRLEVLESERLEKEKDLLRSERQKALAMARALQEQLLAERSGVLLPDSAETINELREERMREFDSVRG